MSTKRDGVSVMILETGEVFNSIQACADHLNVNVNWIRNILNDSDPHKVCRGNHIVRVNKPLPDFDLTRSDYRGRPCVRVMIAETGEIFESITDCAKYINGSTGRISDVFVFCGICPNRTGNHQSNSLSFSCFSPKIEDERKDIQWF